MPVTGGRLGVDDGPLSESREGGTLDENVSAKLSGRISVKDSSQVLKVLEKILTH